MKAVDLETQDGTSTPKCASFGEDLLKKTQSNFLLPVFTISFAMEFFDKF